MTGRYTFSKQVRRHLLLLVASATLVTIPGCGGPDYAHRRVDGDTVIFTDHWSSAVATVVVGLVFVSFGLSVAFSDYYDRLRQRKSKTPKSEGESGKLNLMGGSAMPSSLVSRSRYLPLL